MAGNGDFSDDNAPLHTIDTDAQKAASADSEAVRAASAKLSTPAALAAVPEVQRKVWRSFIAPLFPDAHFLVVRGKVTSFPDMNSAFGRRDVNRDGDKWAVFGGGVLTTDDPEIIAWCLLRDGFHDDPETGQRLPGICVDANDRRAAAWANMKIGQQNLAAREPSIDPSMDVDEMIYPEKAADYGTPEQIRTGAHQDRYLAAEAGSLVETGRVNAEAQQALADRAAAAQEAAKT